MVVVLNMADETRRKRVTIDATALSVKLGVPVIQAIGRKGEGLPELFREARRAGREHLVPNVVPGPVHVERLLAQLIELIGAYPLPDGLAPRFAAIKLLERDACVRKLLTPYLPEAAWEAIAARLAGFETATEQRAEFVMSAVRHNLAFELFESVAKVGRTPRTGVHETLNELLMHPVLGYVILGAVLAGTFVLVFQVGNAVEPWFLRSFERIDGWLAVLPAETLAFAAMHGVVAGLGGESASRCRTGAVLRGAGSAQDTGICRGSHS
jgi:ferrous iron transport protein B